MAQKAHDLTGKVFGTLTAICTVGKNEHGSFLWKCVCSCGREVVACSHGLKCGMTRSCGIYPCKETGAIDISGGVFGKLTVSEYAGSKNKRALWKCVCSCGNIVVVSGKNLRSGNTKSCGCLRGESASKRFTTHGLSSTREYFNVYERNRRELKKKLDGAWSNDMEFSIKKFQPNCVVCGMTEEEHKQKYNSSLEIDHVFPLVKGSGLRPGNAVVLCRHHNGSKLARDLNKLPKEWQVKIIHAAKQFECYWESLQ